MQISLILAFCLGWPLFTYSIECKNPQSIAVKNICENPKLLKLDQELTLILENAKRGRSSSDLVFLNQNWQGWLEFREYFMGNDSAADYQIQMATLENWWNGALCQETLRKPESTKLEIGSNTKGVIDVHGKKLSIDLTEEGSARGSSLDLPESHLLGDQSHTNQFSSTCASCKEEIRSKNGKHLVLRYVLKNRKKIYDRIYILSGRGVKVLMCAKPEFKPFFQMLIESGPIFADPSLENKSK